MKKDIPKARILSSLIIEKDVLPGMIYNKVPMIMKIDDKINKYLDE